MERKRCSVSENAILWLKLQRKVWSATKEGEHLKETYRFEVFLSHSGKQKADYVGWVRERFVCMKPPILGFLDEKDLKPGESSPDLVMRYAVVNCQVGVVILSKDFIQSQYPLLEFSVFAARVQHRQQCCCNAINELLQMRLRRSLICASL